MRALLTSTAGFLGSHMVDRLLADGHDVLGVDNLVTGSLANLEHLKPEPRFEFLQHDVSLPFDSRPVDLVFNIASPASPANHMARGIETLMTGSRWHAQHTGDL